MFSSKIINFVMIGLLLLLVVLHTTQRKKAKDSSSIFTKKRKKGIGTSNKVEKRIYSVLLKLPFTRAYVLNMQKVLEAYFPGNKGILIHLVVLIVGAIAAIAVIVLAIAVMLAPTWDVLLSCMLFIYVCGKGIIDTVIERTEKSILDELDRFLGYLQFNFMQSGMVDVSLHDSIVGKCPLVDKHARAILKVLEADDIDEAQERYLITVRNPFLKELMCNCVVTYLYGDNVVDGQSCFLANIKKLKDRIGEEQLTLQGIKDSFQFVPFLVSLAPFTSILLMNKMATMMPDVEPYYNSYYGYAVKFAIPLMTLACYLIIKRLKSMGEADLSPHILLTKIVEFPAVNAVLVNYYNNNYGQFLSRSKMLKQAGSKLTVYTLAVKQVITAIVCIVFVFVTILTMNFSTKQRIVNEIVGTGSKSSAATEEMSIEMLMIIRAYTDQWLQRDVLGEYNSIIGGASTCNDTVREWVASSVLQSLASESISISDEQALAAVYQYNKEHAQGTKLYTAYLGTVDGPIREENASMYESGVKQLQEFKEVAEKPEAIAIAALQESMANDVANAVCDYNNAFLHWYYVLIALGAGIVGFFVPYYWIAFNEKSMQQSMETEVRQFQALISILKSTKRMSSEEILNWMFKFSVVFKQSIHRCIVQIPSGEEEAFEALLKEETFEPFQTLVRSLMMVDKVGVQQAFLNLDVEQKNYAERCKQQTTHRISSNSALAEFIMMAPYGAVMVLVMMYPLLVESQGQMNNAVSQMMSM